MCRHHAVHGLPPGIVSTVTKPTRLVYLWPTLVICNPQRRFDIDILKRSSSVQDTGSKSINGLRLYPGACWFIQLLWVDIIPTYLHTLMCIIPLFPLKYTKVIMSNPV